MINIDKEKMAKVFSSNNNSCYERILSAFPTSRFELRGRQMTDEEKKRRAPGE